MERIGETVHVYDPSRPPDLFPLDQDADFTLIFKYLDPGHARDMIKLFRGPKILYQVDDLRFPHIQQMMNDMRDTCDFALTFDEDGARMASKCNYVKSQRLLLTADNQLYKPIPGVQKDIDVSFVGSLSYGENHRSRMRMLELVRGTGLKLFVANELFDIPKINEIYNRSKVVLNHATDVGQPFGHGFGYQCRHFEAGFAGATILSNVIDNDDALKNIVPFHDEKSLVEAVKELCRGNGYFEHVMRTTGPRLHRELTESHTPEHRARELVKFAITI